MIKRVNRLDELGVEIVRGEPTEVLYDLGQGDDRTELLLTYMDGKDSYSARVNASPVITLRKDGGGTLIDITDIKGEALRDTDDSHGTSIRVLDSHGDTVQNPYRNLRLSHERAAVLDQPENPPYELEDLLVRLEDNRTLAISQYARPE
jgi:hypothetical protein